MILGRHTNISSNIAVFNHELAELRIGNFTSIGTGFRVFLGGDHRLDWATTYPFGHINLEKFNKFSGAGFNRTSGDVTIGNDVWIGETVTVMGGVTIGDGAVIGANSHVVSNVKPYSVVGGNPAKFYFYRFPKETITKLLELKWWDMPDDQVNEITPLLCSNDFDKLFEVCEGLKNGTIKVSDAIEPFYVFYTENENIIRIQANITLLNSMVFIWTENRDTLLYVGNDLNFDHNLWWIRPDRNLLKDGKRIIIEIKDADSKLVFAKNLNLEL